MPQYRITAPDGKQLLVTAPEGATQDDVLAHVQANYQPAASSAPDNRPQVLKDWIAAHPKTASALRNVGVDLQSFAGGANDLMAGVPNILTSVITGKKLEDITNAQDAAAAESPNAHTAGQVTGLAANIPVAIATGGTGEAGLGALAARGAAQGAAAGALSGFSQRGDVGDAAEGAAFGAATGGVANPAIAKGAPGIAKLVSPTAMKAARALARILPDSPDVIAAGIQAFKNQTGRAPTLQEVTSLSKSRELRNLAQMHPEVSEAVMSADSASAAARPASMAAKVSGTGQAFGSEEVRNALETQASKDFQVVREKGPIQLSQESRDLLEKEILPQMSNLGRAKRDIVAQLEDDGTITGANLDLVRQRLGRLAYAKPGEGFYELKQDLLDTISQHVPELKKAVQNYAEGMQVLEGVQHGEGILSSGDSAANYVAKLKAMSPLSQQSAALGARSSLLSATTGREGSAERLAGRLASDSELRDRLGSVLGPDAADMLKTLGATETNAARASARVTPSLPAAGPDAAGVAHDIAHAGAGAVRAGAGDIVGAAYHGGAAARLFSRLRIPQGARKLLSTWLADPSKADNAIAYLKKAGASDDALRTLMAPAAATGALTLGSEAGAITGQ